ERRANGRHGMLSLRNSQMWMKPIELPHLAVGAPAEITLPRIAQMGVSGCLGTARIVEPGGHLIGKGFVLYEAAVAGRTNGLLVEAYGVEVAAFDPGQLRLDECRPVGEILGAMQCPGVELLQVFRQPRAMIFAI